MQPKNDLALNLEIQLLQTKDLEELKELISVFERVFEMKNFSPPDDAHLQKLLERETFLAVVGKINNKVIAGLTVYVLDQYYSERPLAYIYDLAVLKDYLRKGIGKRLIGFTNEYCREKGFEEVFVQADKVDDYAIEFYRATGATAEEQVVHFYYELGSTTASNKVNT